MPTARKKKPHLAPRLDPLRDLTRLAIRLVEAERELAIARAALRAERARNADLASRVPVDLKHARRTLNGRDRPA